LEEEEGWEGRQLSPSKLPQICGNTPYPPPPFGNFNLEGGKGEATWRRVRRGRGECICLFSN